jgi:hypothetical protein
MLLMSYFLLPISQLCRNKSFSRMAVLPRHAESLRLRWCCFRFVSVSMGTIIHPAWLWPTLGMYCSPTYGMRIHKVCRSGLAYPVTRNLFTLLLEPQVDTVSYGTLLAPSTMTRGSVQRHTTQMMFATRFTRCICCSQYAHNSVMQTGIPVCKFFSDPRPYAYGDPHMRTAIPVCIILHMGIQDLISHMETISLCIRLVTEISPYAYRHLTNPHMHTGIMSHAVPVCIQWSSRSPYAYGRS